MLLIEPMIRQPTTSTEKLNQPRLRISAAVRNTPDEMKSRV